MKIRKGPVPLSSTRFVVKPEGVSNVFLPKPVGVNENLGLQNQREGLNPQPRTNRALQLSSEKRTRGNSLKLSKSTLNSDQDTVLIPDIF